jgi:Zn-dependent protease/CBS domain-containing protein
MGWSITIGRFAGTAVRIHVTFLLFLAWIGFSAFARGGAAAARENLIFIIAIFTCVVLHEFGHILVAKRFGITSKEVTLLPIGGVADINKMPEKPSQELMIAIAGPAVNLVIAGVLLLGVDAIRPEALAHLDDPGSGLVGRLAVTNIFLAVFNMVPAFPMDGGRVLHAVLGLWLGETRATRIAAAIGQAFALLLGFLGLFGHPMLLFIALFIFFAASGEAQMSLTAQSARGVKVSDAMETRITTIDRGATISDAIEILLATPQDCFPLIDDKGALVGMLSRTDIVDALKNAAPDAPIAAFAQKDFPTIGPGETLDKALDKLNDAAVVGVAGEDGVLQGLVTGQSLAEVMLIKAARPDWRFSRPPKTPPK